MKKISKRTLKKFENIVWDTTGRIKGPCEIQCESMNYLTNEGVEILEFFLERTDKHPFVSIFFKKLDNITDSLISFGDDKQRVFKKAKSVSFNTESVAKKPH